MSGTGYYSKDEGLYKALPTRQWDDYDSAGLQWDSWVQWDENPGTSVAFTTEIFDLDERKTFAPLVDIDASMPAKVTVITGDTVDSSGGTIDSATTETFIPNQTGITTKTARFVQMTVTIEQDSGGVEIGESDTPYIRRIQPNFLSQFNTQDFDNIDTSTLSGSTGQRTLFDGSSNNTQVISCFVQILNTTLTDDSAGHPATPVIYVEKTATTVVLHIFDVDSYGKRKRIDCVVDAQIRTLPSLRTNNSGSIVET